MVGLRKFFCNEVKKVIYLTPVIDGLSRKIKSISDLKDSEKSLAHIIFPSGSKRVPDVDDNSTRASKARVTDSTSHSSFSG